MSEKEKLLRELVIATGDPKLVNALYEFLVEIAEQVQMAVNEITGNENTRYLIQADDGLTYSAHNYSDADRQDVKREWMDIIRLSDGKKMAVNKYDQIEWVDLPKWENGGIKTNKNLCKR